MNARRVSTFVDALLSDRRPVRFGADPVDAQALRMAVALRAARSGEVAPDPRFVEHLRGELAVEARSARAPAHFSFPARSMVTTRSRLLLGVAAVAMMGGTVAATTTVEHALAAASVSHVTHGNLVRVSKFESAAGHAVGQIVAYRGDPSWVLMSIRDPGMNAAVDCRIEMSNGQAAATGTFVVHNGVGEFARPVSADIGQFRRATLVMADGSVLATATFPTS